MRKILVFVCFCFGLAPVFSQVTEAEDELKARNSDTLMGWSRQGLFSIQGSQVSLTNWAAGGQNSISITGIFNYTANYKAPKYSWDNSIDLGYGIVKQGDANWFKSDDKLDFTSKYGWNIRKKKLYLAGLLNLKTQMTDGYNSPADTQKISTFFAPGYLLAAIGLDLKPNDKLSAFIAPLTSKMTFVLDDELSRNAAFGVDSSKTSRVELGGYARIVYNHKNIVKNVNFSTRLELFGNYLENLGVVDVNWETLIGMKVNKFLTVNLNTLLIYDQDIDIDTGKLDDEGNPIIGPRVQFKEVLGVGLSFQF